MQKYFEERKKIDPQTKDCYHYVQNLGVQGHLYRAFFLIVMYHKPFLNPSPKLK